MLSLVRSVLTYGLVARGVTPREYRMLEQAENKILCRVYEAPRWKLKLQGKKLGCLRFEGGVLPLTSWVNYMKARFFAHTMRRGNDHLPRMAITGKFFPNLSGADDCSWYLAEKRDLSATDRSNDAHTLVGNVISWLTEACSIPTAALPFLVSNCRSDISQYNRMKKILICSRLNVS